MAADWKTAWVLSCKSRDCCESCCSSLEKTSAPGALEELLLLISSVMCYSADEALCAFPVVLCWGSDAAAAVASVPLALCAGLNPPRWPLTRPASSSPAPPLESKSWAGRAVRLILQRSAEKREAAETRRASLRDQLKHTNTHKTHFFTSAATIFRGADAIMQTKSHHFICTVIHITAGVHITQNILNEVWKYCQLNQYSVLIYRVLLNINLFSKSRRYIRQIIQYFDLFWIMYSLISSWDSHINTY